MLFFERRDNTASSISLLHAKVTSPVSSSNISLEVTFPKRYSFEKEISFSPESLSNLTCLAVTLLPASTITLFLTFMSSLRTSPLNLSGLNSVFTLDLSSM